MQKKKEIIILGGGPAGMACSMELYKNRYKSIIIEKDFKIGGLAKTLEFREGKYIFRTDIGPHRFLSKNQYLYEFIEDLLNEKWIIVRRQTRQYIDNKYYDYPINVLQALKNIGVLKAIGMGFSYLNALIGYHIFKKEIKNFEDYIVSNFGRKLGEFNMLNYTEKIWGVSCKKIHPDWAMQRIKGLNITSTLKNALFKKDKDGPKSLVDNFYYPQYGTGLIYDTIAKKIKKDGSEININSFATKIIHEKNKIKSIELSVNGKKRIIHPSKAVSSIPITEFVEILSPKPPAKVIKAASQLKWRSQVYLFITLNKNKITDDNWIYFPNKEIPFGRISEMKNFSKHMSPKDKTSLLVEFFVYENDTIWNMDNRNLFNMAMETFEKLKLFSKKEVRHYYVFKKKYVYPIYDMDYKKKLKLIREYLDNFDNLIYIGRPGRFQYTNQDHSLEMGILAAQSIIKRKKLNFDDIGSEKEYFEK